VRLWDAALSRRRCGGRRSQACARARWHVCVLGVATADSLAVSVKPYQYGITENLEALFAEQGFSEVRSFEVPVIVRFARPEQVLDVLLEGGLRSRSLLEAQTPDAFEKIRSAAIERAAEFASGGGIAIPRPALIAVGAALGD